MRHSIIKIYLLTISFITSSHVFPQPFITDTSGEKNALHSAISLYHSFLSPESGLYNGSEYPYNAYYPFTINEGHPFFQSKEFYAGSVFYNNMMYENVPLLFDIIKEELLTRDPTNIYVIMLNMEKVEAFNIQGHTFIRLIPDNTNSSVLNPGFYDVLYKGSTPLFKKVTKKLQENSASISGINDYIVESDEYFIKKNYRYYRVKNKKSLMPVLSDRKKEVAQFIKKNRLNFKKNADEAFKTVLAYYDQISNVTTKVVNR